MQELTEWEVMKTEKVFILLMVPKSGNVGESFKYDQVSYVDYAEGIYVGYKWYETADAQDYWDKYIIFMEEVTRL